MFLLYWYKLQGLVGHCHEGFEFLVGRVVLNAKAALGSVEDAFDASYEGLGVKDAESVSYERSSTYLLYKDEHKQNGESDADPATEFGKLIWCHLSMSIRVSTGFGLRD